MPPVAFLELLNRKSSTLQQVAEALADDRMKNVALSEHEAIKALKIWQTVTSCITSSGETELSPAAALQLSRKLVYELPNVARYERIWSTAVPILCEGVRTCVALLRWDPDSADCQDTVAVFLESIEVQITTSPQFKEFLFCGDSMSDILLTAALEAVTPKSNKAGSSFSETASCLWFCARLLLMFVTKCQKNQQAVAAHQLIEPLLRDVLPCAATVEQQLLIVEILVRVLRKNTLPPNAAAHIFPILEGINKATTQKELPFHDHLTNLVLTLNKHNSTICTVQPHMCARLKGAVLANSAIAVEVPDRAVVMYGGPKLALSLTFVLDTGVEKDFCTLFTSDLADVQHRPADDSDSTVVTLILGSVRTATGTNMCLQQAARSIPDGDSGLAIELELSEQDAALLVGELKGPQRPPQKSTSCTRSQKTGHTSCDSAKEKDQIEGGSQQVNKQTIRKCSAARGPVYCAKLELKPVHPKKPKVPVSKSAPCQTASAGPKMVQKLKQNRNGNNEQDSVQPNRKRPKQLSAPQALAPKMPSAPAEHPERCRKGPAKSADTRAQKFSQPCSPDLIQVAPEPLVTSPAASPREDPAPRQALTVDKKPTPAAMKTQPAVKMQRQGKLSNIGRLDSAANISKGPKPDIQAHDATDSKQGPSVNNAKAMRRRQPPPSLNCPASDPIEASFDPPKDSHEQQPGNKKSRSMKDLEPTVAATHSKGSSSQGAKHGTATEAKRPDRKGLTRNAKANVRYVGCDAESNDEGESDPFKPLSPRSKAIKPRPESPVHTHVAPQKRSRGKGQQPKPTSSRAKLRALAAQHEAPTAPVGNNQDVLSPVDDGENDAQDHEHDHTHTPAQQSVTVGTNAAPQNSSLASLNPSMKYVPDTGDTAAHVRERAKKPKDVTPVQAFKDHIEPAARPVAGKVVPSPLSGLAANKVQQLTFSNLGLTEQHAWQQNSNIGNQRLSEGMLRSGDMGASIQRYSPLMGGNIAMQFGMSAFGQSLPGQVQGQLGFAGQHGHQDFMQSAFPSSGFGNQIGKADALRSTSNVNTTQHKRMPSFMSAQAGATGGQQKDAAMQPPRKLKRARAPEAGGKSARQKKGCTEEDLEKAEALAEEQESKKLMQMINTMMQDEDATDDPGAMQQLQNSLSKLMKKKQQRKRNRGKRIVEDGQEKIDNSISEAQAQYLREEKELEANFQDKLNEIEANMAEKWKQMGEKHDAYLQALQHEWTEYQLLGQTRTSLCTHQHQQVAQFREKWQHTLAQLEDNVQKELITLEDTLQKQKKKESRKKGLQAAQKMLQSMF